MEKTTVPGNYGLATTDGPARPQKTVEGTSATPSAFLGVAFGMGWQLMVVVLVPIFGGFKLDQVFGISPALTLLGLLVALAGAYLVIRRTLAAMNNFNVPAPADAKDTKDAETTK